MFQRPNSFDIEFFTSQRLTLLLFGQPMQSSARLVKKGRGLRIIAFCACDTG